MVLGLVLLDSHEDFLHPKVKHEGIVFLCAIGSIRLCISCFMIEFHATSRGQFPGSWELAQKDSQTGESFQAAI